jgi:hypothetical protein
VNGNYLIQSQIEDELQKRNQPNNRPILQSVMGQYQPNIPVLQPNLPVSFLNDLYGETETKPSKNSIHISMNDLSGYVCDFFIIILLVLSFITY